MKKNSISLGVLFALACLVSQPIKPTADWPHKTARIALHAAQVVAGCYFVDRFYYNFVHQDFWPLAILKKCWQYKLSATSHGVGSATLLWYGFKGLDEELGLWGAIKKQHKRFAKR